MGVEYRAGTVELGASELAVEALAVALSGVRFPRLPYTSGSNPRRRSDRHGGPNGRVLLLKGGVHHRMDAGSPHQKSSRPADGTIRSDLE